MECAIRSSWSIFTTSLPHSWSKNNPALGQASITAVLVKELLGGDILRGEDAWLEPHYWNMLENGIKIDLTIDQFGFVPKFFNVKIIDEMEILKNPGTLYRFSLLKEKYYENK